MSSRYIYFISLAILLFSSCSNQGIQQNEIEKKKILPEQKTVNYFLKFKTANITKFMDGWYPLYIKLESNLPDDTILNLIATKETLTSDGFKRCQFEVPTGKNLNISELIKGTEFPIRESSILKESCVVFHYPAEHSKSQYPLISINISTEKDNKTFEISKLFEYKK